MNSLIFNNIYFYLFDASIALFKAALKPAQIGGFAQCIWTNIRKHSQLQNTTNFKDLYILLQVYIFIYEFINFP